MGTMVSHCKMVVQYHLSWIYQNDTIQIFLWPKIPINGVVCTRYLQGECSQYNSSHKEYIIHTLKDNLVWHKIEGNNKFNVHLLKGIKCFISCNLINRHHSKTNLSQIYLPSSMVHIISHNKLDMEFASWLFQPTPRFIKYFMCLV